MKKLLGILKTQTIKDSLVVSIGLGTTAVLGFLYTVLMARVLLPESFGVFSAITSLVAIVYSLGDLGVGPAIINFLPKLKKSDFQLITTTFWLQYLIGLVVALLLWFGAKFSGFFIPGSLPEHFFLVGSLSFNYILIGWSQSIFTAQKSFFRLSLSQVIDAVVKISIVLYLFKLGELSISTAIMANCVSAILAFLATFWRSLLKVGLSFDTVTFKDIFHYSKWIALSRFFSVFFSRIDIIILNLLASNYSAGIYAAASRVTLLFAMIVSSLGSVVNPRFSSFKSKKEAKDYIKKLFILISGISTIVLVLAIFAKQIILLVFGLGFSDSVKVFQLLSLSMIPFLFSVIFTASILYTFNQPKFYALITFIQFLVILVIDFTLIPRLGIYAPVLASAVSNTLIFILSALKVKWLFLTKPISNT